MKKNHLQSRKENLSYVHIPQNWFSLNNNKIAACNLST